MACKRVCACVFFSVFFKSNGFKGVKMNTLDHLFPLLCFFYPSSMSSLLSCPPLTLSSSFLSQSHSTLIFSNILLFIYPFFSSFCTFWIFSLLSFHLGNCCKKSFFTVCPVPDSRWSFFLLKWCIYWEVPANCEQSWQEYCEILQCVDCLLVFTVDGNPNFLLPMKRLSKLN